MKVRNTVLKSLSFIGIFILFSFVTLILTLTLITHGPSEKSRNLFATTMLETGALKWMVGIFLDSTTVNEIVKENSLQTMSEEVDTTLIEVKKDDTKKDNIEIETINGSNYKATLMIVHDPSKVSVGSTYPFSTYGTTLEKLVNKYDAIGGVNGGLYQQNNGAGGYPLGVLVSNSVIQYNEPTDRKGYVLVGLDKSNILKILDLDGMNKEEVEELINKENIRDAVTFQEEASDTNNHFVKLIVNGQVRSVSGNGSGANPRTVIGQKEDGSLLLLVTDGRGANGHLGATASDLIDIMKKYGAVNAANIDGGSSSSMYYDGKYLMSSTTLYYSNSSYKLPDGFIVSK